jgi:hypothetical protein
LCTISGCGAAFSVAAWLKQPFAVVRDGYWGWRVCPLVDSERASKLLYVVG